MTLKVKKKPKKTNSAAKNLQSEKLEARSNYFCFVLLAFYARIRGVMNSNVTFYTTMIDILKLRYTQSLTTPLPYQRIVDIFHQLSSAELIMKDSFLIGSSRYVFQLKGDILLIDGPFGAKRFPLETRLMLFDENQKTIIYFQSSFADFIIKQPLRRIFAGTLIGLIIITMIVLEISIMFFLVPPILILTLLYPIIRSESLATKQVLQDILSKAERS